MIKSCETQGVWLTGAAGASVTNTPKIGVRSAQNGRYVAIFASIQVTKVFLKDTRLYYVYV